MRTPGPYLREGRTIYTLESIGYRRGVEQFRNRIYAGFLGGPDTPTEEVEATAAYFQKAANLHDELVAALKDIRSMCIPGMNWTDEIGRMLLEQADKVLAKATQEAQNA